VNYAHTGAPNLLGSSLSFPYKTRAGRSLGALQIWVIRYLVGFEHFQRMRHRTARSTNYQQPGGGDPRYIERYNPPAKEVSVK
jgi:hypothetical protein